MADSDPIPPSEFKAIFEASPAACLILTPELNIIAASEAYLRATMTQRDQILGRGLFEVFPDDPQDPHADGTSNLRASLDRVRAGLCSDYMAVQHYPIRRPDGTFESRYWRPGNHPVLGPDGKLAHIVHHVQDVTRQREAEAALQALAMGPGAVLPIFFDGMFEGVQVIDFEGRYLYLNETAAAQGQRPREDLIGQRMADLYPGIDQTEFYTLLQRCLSAQEKHQITNHFTYPDGSQAWFELRLSPVPVGALIFSSDISLRVKLEEALRSAERLEAVGRLAGGIAHDFNNLVTVISGYANLLHDALPDGDARREGLGMIQAAGERAGDLTRQLLAFSRKQVLQPKVLDLNDSLRAVAKFLRRLIGEDIDLVLRPQPGLDLVCVDPGQLEQIIMNLALNARDAMPEGGKLTLETANVDLDEAYVAQHSEAKAGPHVLLAVTDTGHGMDSATRARIFEPFFTTKQLGRGTGLGLATVHGIVRQSGGNIWVYSEPDQGTCFKVFLPSSGKARSLEPDPKGGASKPQGAACILLVEDEDGVRRLFETVLRSAGYQVLSAPDAEHALQLCRQHPGTIDLLLSDMVLPRVGGKQLAVEVTALRPGIKVVFMSGYTDTAIVHQGVLDAGTAFISKPVSPSVLLKRIGEYLQSP